jgi:hypothetical protein
MNNPKLRPPYQRGIVVAAPFVRVVRERAGGWLVVTHPGHGWLHGSRQSALDDKRWLDAQQRRRRRWR